MHDDIANVFAKVFHREKIKVGANDLMARQTFLAFTRMMMKMIRVKSFIAFKILIRFVQKPCLRVDL